MGTPGRETPTAAIFPPVPSPAPSTGDTATPTAASDNAIHAAIRTPTRREENPIDRVILPPSSGLIAPEPPGRRLTLALIPGEKVDQSTYIEVIQDVVILSVESREGAVRVDLYGGDGSACGHVVYHFEPKVHRAQTRQLRRWHQADTPLTYVRNGENVTLIHEASFFQAAWGDDDVPVES